MGKRCDKNNYKLYLPLTLRYLLSHIYNHRHPIRKTKYAGCYIFLDDNIALVQDGATCDSSSYSDNHTCLNTLLGDNSYWQTDGEGPGAWIKVSFPRADVARVGLLSGCDSSGKIKTLLAGIKTLDSDFEVF